jgi:hypothetical protein
MKTRKTKIINLVLKKKEEINQPGEPGSAAAAANKRKAIAAVTGGIKSPAWEAYMRQFVSENDEEQLMRLLGTDGTDTSASQNLIDNRAYLVSNGVCGEGTRERFDENVKTIDQGLETDCEPLV